MVFSPLTRVARMAGLDRAVSFGAIGRLWQLATGPILVAVITIGFTPEMQGYYFAFASLLALSVFFELGLAQIIIQYAAHEWAFLERSPDGSASGADVPLDRLASIAKFAFVWFGSCAAIFCVVGSAVGLWFFAKSAPAVKMAWVLCCILTSFDLCILCALSLLEGCGQIAVVYFCRMVRTMLNSLVLWPAVFFGLGLWSLPLGMLACLLWNLLFIYRYRIFFSSLLCRSPNLEHRVHWRGELLPLQWRVGVSWIAGYLSGQIFVPVLFRVDGPVVAGQFGMSWALINTVGSLASLFVQTKAPTFAGLIAKRDYALLDRLALRAGSVSSLVCAAGCLAIGIGDWMLVLFHPLLAARLLDLTSLVPLLVAMSLLNATVPCAIYLRAHKREPLVGISVASGILSALTAIVGAHFYGAIGVSLGYMLGVIFFVVPGVYVIFYRCRQRWHVNRAGFAGGSNS